MVYTEIKQKNGKKYYYRVISIREGDKIKKKRIYLGANMNKSEIAIKEKEADKELIKLNNLLAHKELNFLEEIKKQYLKEPKENWENRYESFCALFTYDSNAIEGNTLTLQETAQLLFEERVPSNKSLREINEALNHKKAFDYILNYKGDITKDFILELHKLVIKDTLRKDLDSQIGKYRTLQVYIRGAQIIPVKPEEVPKEMKSLVAWYSKSKKKLHPLIIAAYFHTAFEGIHPFVDGNGRVGRLLMNFILHKNKYPMINIPNNIKYDYYKNLEEAQTNGNLRQFIEMLISILREDKIKL